MKKIAIILLSLYILSGNISKAYGQCSICTKTAAQQGEKAGRGMNSGIVYLMFMPFGIIAYIGYRYWRQSKQGQN